MQSIAMAFQDQHQYKHTILSCTVTSTQPQTLSLCIPLTSPGNDCPWAKEQFVYIRSEVFLMGLFSHSGNDVMYEGPVWFYNEGERDCSTLLFDLCYLPCLFSVFHPTSAALTNSEEDR